MSGRTWRERHPFLYGMSQTFGIFPVRQPVDTPQQSFARVTEAIRQAEEAVKPDCPICVHINRWWGGDIRKATHGAGGPDWSWSACWEHFQTISAFQWLDGLGEFGNRPWERT